MCNVKASRLFCFKNGAFSPINNDLEVAHPHSGSSSTWFLVQLEFRKLFAVRHHELDYLTEIDSDSLRRKSAFRDVTTGFPAKWSLRNERRNSILMTSHYPDLGSASDWLKPVAMTRHRYGISVLVSNSKGAFHSTKISEITRAQWDSTFRLHKPDLSHRAFDYCSVSRIQKSGTGDNSSV